MRLPSIIQISAATVKHFLLISLFCLPFTLKAETFDNQGRVDFNLHLQSVDSDWRYNKATRRTRINRAGVGWSETLGPRLSGGLMLGYLDLSQADNPVDTAKLGSGYYGGLHFDIKFIENHHLHLKLKLSLLYNNSQNQTANLHIENLWIQTEENLLAKIPLNKQLTFRLGLNRYQLRGEQRSHGSLTSVSNFHQDQSIGYSVGLDVLVDYDASIGFDWSGGSRQGGRLYFRRLF